MLPLELAHLVVFLRFVEEAGTLREQHRVLGRQVDRCLLVRAAFLDVVFVVLLVEQRLVDAFVEVFVVAEGRQAVVALRELLVDIFLGRIRQLRGKLIVTAPISVYLQCWQNVQLELQGIILLA